LNRELIKFVYQAQKNALTEATGFFFQEFEVDWQHLNLHLIISII